MLSSTYLRGLKVAQSSVVTRRSQSSASDPIQKLFIDKIKEYRQKSEGGKLVEPSEEVTRELTKEISKIEKQYGAASGVDMTAFPAFKFADPKLDPIDDVVAAPKDAKGKGAKGDASKKSKDKPSKK